MKRKYVTVITLSLAIVLAGSIAYASDKRKKAKLLIPEPSEMSEEALKTEFLTTSEDQLKNQPDFKDSSLIENADVDLAELNVN